jgi:glycosyltransferase involved in cell wall biosynthesis
MDKSATQPLISVIVPVYKVEAYLNKCIDSIINQTYKNLEIILVDDGSPDNCGTICDEYAKIDNRIKVIHKTNGGLSDARNAGLNIATGDWITFVDSDDWIDYNLYSLLLEHSIHEDLIVFDVRHIFQNSKCVEPDKHKGFSITIDDNNIQSLLDLLISSKLGYTCNKLFKRTKIGNLIFQNIPFREDLIFILKYLENIHTLKYIPVCGYNYLQRNSSLLHKNNLIDLRQIDIVEDHLKVGISKISKKHNLAIYNYILLPYLTDILIRDIIRNDSLTSQEKLLYTQNIFEKNFIKNIKFRYCKNKMQLFFVFCTKLHNHKLFLQILK